MVQEKATPAPIGSNTCTRHVHGDIPPKWRKGPPPEIGWWPASMYRSKSTIRWWNGVCWSVPVDWGATSRQAEVCARVFADGDIQGDIEWTDRWWLK
jgi:hypothetical protein